MARVHVDDDTWRVFKNAAGDTPISDLLGQLVTRHVHHYQARQAQAAALDDRDLLAALERAAGLQRDLGDFIRAGVDGPPKDEVPLRDLDGNPMTVEQVLELVREIECETGRKLIFRRGERRPAA